jgi:hypothetical protein
MLSWQHWRCLQAGAAAVTIALAAVEAATE